MKLKGVLFLAALTSRSQAYIQAMAAVGMRPDQTLVMGAKTKGLPGQVEALVEKETGRTELFYPSLAESVFDTLENNGIPYTQIETTNINDPVVEKALIRCNPEIVIYSGYGGQIVGKALLDLGFRFLHIHSGWLPDYRGSTTMYYSLLNEGECGASAIFLSSKIDEGPVIAKKKYAPPPDGVDLDHVYDGVIRADLLVEVLTKYADQKKITPLPPKDRQGNDYYVIHPVLKHLVRLRLDQMAR